MDFWEGDFCTGEAANGARPRQTYRHKYALDIAYSRMTRTTLVLDDQLLGQMKKKAADEGRSLQAVANELIQSYRLKLQGWESRSGICLGWRV